MAARTPKSREPDQVDLPALFTLVGRFARQHYPGSKAAQVRIVLADGRTTRIDVQDWGCPDIRPPGPIDVDQLDAQEQAVVDALTEIDAGVVLTGEELAERAGYPHNGRFREVLARLVRLGVIINRRPGYALPV